MSETHLARPGAVRALGKQVAHVEVQPDTVLRWHRDLFRRVWKHKSKRKQGRPPLTDDIVASIERIVEENLQTYDILFRTVFVFVIIEWLAEECVGQGRGQPQAYYH